MLLNYSSSIPKSIQQFFIRITITTQKIKHLTTKITNNVTLKHLKSRVIITITEF